MSQFDFEGRCEECGERVNILIDRLSTNSMKLTADECLDHPGESHILWPQRDDIIEQIEVVKPQDAEVASKYDFYQCARCGFKTSKEDVIDKHVAECKVPLNRYGG